MSFYYVSGTVDNRIRNSKVEVIYISALNVFNHDLGMDFSS